MYTCVPPVCWVPAKVRKGHHITGTGVSDDCEPNPISPASVLKCWATSSAPIFVCAFEIGSQLVFLAVLELPV